MVPNVLWDSALQPPNWHGTSDNDLEKVMNSDPEVKKVAVNKVEVKEVSQKLTTSEQDPELFNYTEDAVNKILHYYSGWTKLKRAVAW